MKVVREIPMRTDDGGITGMSTYVLEDGRRLEPLAIDDREPCEFQAKCFPWDKNGICYRTAYGREWVENCNQFKEHINGTYQPRLF